MTNSTNGRLNATKRIINQSSSDLEDTPIAKRAKSSLPTQDSPLTSALSSSREDEVKEIHPQGHTSDDTDDDDDQPIAHLKHKLPPAPKRSIDESSASTTLTTNTDDPKLKSNKKIKNLASQSITVKKELNSSSDDDQPLVARPTTKKVTRKKQITVKKEEYDSDEDTKPLVQTAPSKPKKRTNQSKASSAKKTKTESDEDVKPNVKKESQTQAEIEEAEMYKWWEENKDDDSKKWTTLEHNGVLFPPDYDPLPSYVRMKYCGRAVDLPPESEEVAYFFGSMLNSEHVQKETFCKNFFRDFLNILEIYPPRDGTKIKDFSKCDFTPIFDYVESEREKKKSLSSERKKKLKEEKDLAEAKYKTCLLDGRVEKVGNFRVEPPSLFRGRGQHPKTGRLKKRVYAEDITINCSADSKVPDPPPGHQWGKVVHDDKASWLAFWKENINGATKYVFLAAGSSLKGQSDLKKYEKARQLKDHIDRIRAHYQSQLTDKLMATRQRATAIYLIDRFALRAGNEKGDDEAETFGCCSLKVEHITLQPPNIATFDFLGKDSIRFYNSFPVDDIVFKNLRIFKKNKAGHDDLFDRLNSSKLNKHLADYMPGLTAKVFRTYNASTTFERELSKNMAELPKDASMPRKMLAYNRANRSVALLCNHQKTVSKNHGSAMERATDKMRGIKYQRRRLRWSLLNHPELDEVTRALFANDDESDLDDEWIEKHEIALEERKKEAILKKYAKMEEDDEIERKKTESEREAESKALIKAEEEGKKVKKKSIPPLSVREEEKQNELTKVEGLAKILKEERESKKISNDKRTTAQLLKAISSCDNSIFSSKSNLVDKDENKETSLGTSKTNYIDPRISFAWAAAHGVDPKKIFPKTLQEKFTWAKATEPDWKF